MKLVGRIVLFVLLNFSALAIGGLYTGDGVSSDWYTSLNQAPWTPPGWVFGVAWTIIMICFSIYMALFYKFKKHRKKLISLYILQIILNIAWNPIFFYLRDPLVGLLVISLLTVIVFYILSSFYKLKKLSSTLILPYALWLCIATSLNFYILIFN